MLGTFINIDPNFASSTLSTAGILITDFQPIWSLAIIVLVAVLGLSFIVSLFHK